MTAQHTISAAVIGGGTMGAGIAAVLARAGYDVSVVDIDAPSTRRAADGARAVLSDLLARGKLGDAHARDASARIVGFAGGLAELPHGLELIVEAVPERLELKRDLLAQADACLPAILATNTSALSIDDLAAGLTRVEHFLGLHFFNPVPAMGLVEVVVGSRTSPATVDAATALVARLEKESIVVNDSPGFATTRLGVALGLEAIRMVEDGVASPGDIDRAMVLGYRHPVGPLRLTDIVGLDVRLDIADSLAQVYGARYAAPELMREMVREGRLGRKSGVGFYEWTGQAT